MISRNLLTLAGVIVSFAAGLLMTTGTAQAADRYGNPGIEALEDCIRFNPNRVEASREGGRWKVVEGSHWMFDFGDGPDARREARAAAAIIKRYGMTESCYVGRPHAEFKYLLSNRAAPSGSLPNEDCINFNERALRINAEGSRWLLTDGRSRMLMFNRAEEAYQALFLIRYYGFGQHCFVGRPNPDFEYWRR